MVDMLAVRDNEAGLVGTGLAYQANRAIVYGLTRNDIMKTHYSRCGAIHCSPSRAALC